MSSNSSDSSRCISLRGSPDSASWITITCMNVKARMVGQQQEVLVCLNSSSNMPKVASRTRARSKTIGSADATRHQPGSGDADTGGDMKSACNVQHAGQNPTRLRKLWRQADAVCFDVDSTVCQDEAIDELAYFLGVGDEVKRCTQKAMGGGMTFREALTLRLDIIRPSRHNLERYAAINPIRLTPGIKGLISELHSRDVHVYLVSGGFRCLIEPVAEVLGIDKKTNVYANEILFDENGHYAGFCKNELTSDSGSIEVGKAGVCRLLKAIHGYETLLMVGDGATDAEACPPADGFIGFGGNQVRESVKQLSEWYIYDFKTLHQELLADRGAQRNFKTK